MHPITEGVKVFVSGVKSLWLQGVHTLNQSHITPDKVDNEFKCFQKCPDISS